MPSGLLTEVKGDAVVAGDAHCGQPAARVSSDSARELPLPHSAFQQESYGGKPRLPRPPAHEYKKAGIPVPKRWVCIGCWQTAALSHDHHRLQNPDLHAASVPSFIHVQQSPTVCACILRCTLAVRSIVPS